MSAGRGRAALQRCILLAAVLVGGVAGGLWAEDGAPTPGPVAVPAPAEVPAAVLAAAAAAGKAPVPLIASPAALATAEQIDAQLLAADTLLARGSTVAAGDCFMAAAKLFAGLGRADRHALGERYREQRRHLGLIAERLLADPAVRAALGSDPLVPTDAEHAAAIAAPAEPAEQAASAPADVPPAAPQP